METLTLPKERPLLFRTPMVQGVLDGLKTQTRRTSGLEEVNRYPYQSQFAHLEVTANGELLAFFENADGELGYVECPYGNVGDILWVRETWGRFVPEHVIDKKYFYKADVKSAEGEQYRLDYVKAGFPYKYKASIHMPKDACRIRLRITDVRVERIWDISPYDAKAEGIEMKYPYFKNYMSGLFDLLETAHISSDYYHLKNAHAEVLSFATLWESINGYNSWIENPWVWCISFERI